MEAMKESERTRTIKGSTRRPGESSVYSLSMVLEDPPAPAERVELGLATCDAPARRRICAPGGLETAPLADVDREETERVGASESDMVNVV